jgi:hypothetical protein
MPDIVDVLSKKSDGTRSSFGDNGSVGGGNVDCEDMGVATASSSGPVELSPLKVRLNTRLLDFSRSPPKCQPSVHASTSTTSSTDGWSVNLLDARSGSAVRGR